METVLLLIQHWQVSAIHDHSVEHVQASPVVNPAHFNVSLIKRSFFLLHAYSTAETW